MTTTGLSVAPEFPVKIPSRIVLIEDAEPDVCLVREALENCGVDFDLQVFEDGESAVDFVDSFDQDPTLPAPHLILLDLNLPKKGGAQVLEHVRSNRSCAHVPVLILTSSDSPKDKALVKQLGATDYFRKPSRLDEYMKLGPLVQRMLGADPGERLTTG